MSKITISDLLNQNQELEDVDRAMMSGEYGDAKPIDILRAKRKKMQEDFAEKQSNSKVPYHKRKNASTEAASFGDPNNKENRYNYLETEINKENPGNEDSLFNRSGQLDEQGQAVDSKTTAARSFLDNTKRNAKKGLGDFISGWGDIFQVAGAGIGTATQMGDFSELMFDGNMLSRAMQEYGGDMAKANENYIPEEVQNAQFNAATFLNPEFWSTHGGQFIPQLTEILGTIGASSLIKKGAEAGGRALIKDIISESLERVATKEVGEAAFEQGVKSGAKNVSTSGSWWKKNILGDVASTTEAQYVGAAGRQSVKGSGSGILGKTFTDQGKFTQGFGDLVQGVSGGAITNLTVSLRNAGEVFNTYKNVYQRDQNGNVILDEQGQPKRVFSDEQLGEMASDTFTTNMQYMLADIMSWGMTYGKGWNHLGSYGSKIASVGGQAIQKVAPQLMSKLSMPVLSNVAKWSGKALAEGFEEQVQESYEEWSKMKAYHDVHGSLKGYQGMKLSKDYDMTSGTGPFASGFYDFLTSKDSEALRAISMGLGALAGGTFNIKSVIDKQANDVYKLQTRSENLRQIFEKGTDGRAWQDKFIHDQMAELVMENKGGVFQDFVQSMYNEGKVDDDDVLRYGQLYNKIASEYDKIKDLKISGKKAYMKNAAEEIHFQNKIQEATETYQKNRESILSILNTIPEEEKTESFKSDVDKKLKKEENLFKAKITPLANALTTIKSNKTNLLLDKEANAVDYDVAIQYDENGNPDIQYVEKEIDRNNSTSPENIAPETNENSDKDYDEMFKNGWNNVKEKGKVAKEWIKNILGFANGEENNEQNEESKIADTDIASKETDIEEKVDGAIEALANSFNSLEDIDAEIQNNENQIKNLNTSNENNNISYDKTLNEINKKESEEIDLIAPLLPLNFNETSEEKRLRKENEIKRNEIEKKYNTERKKIKNNGLEGLEIQELQKRNEDLKKAKQFKSKFNEQKDNKASEQKFDNKNIVETDEEFGISQKDKNQFKKTGTIGSHVIPFLANKLNTNQKLTKSEQSIYDAFKNKIDSAAEQEVSQMEEMMQSPDVDEETKSYIKNMLLSKRKKQLSDKNKIEGLNEKPNLNQEEDWTREGRAKKEAIQNALKNVKSKFFTSQSGNKNLGFITKFFSKLKNVTVNRRDPDFGNNEFLNFTQSIQISNALQKIYPNQNINVYSIQDMYRTVGLQAFGYTLAAQIYIDENSWNQDKVFMHEMAHIYYSLNQNEPETKTILSYALKNKALVNQILTDYDDEIQFELRNKDENGNPIIATKSDILGNLYNMMTEEEKNTFFENQIKEGNLLNIPLERQEIILDEIFAATMEGPLSNQYNKFFNEKIEEERKRRFLAKKFWSKVKSKGENFSDKNERKIFFETLIDNDKKFADTMSGVIEAFAATKLSDNVSASGRASKSRQLNQTISDKLDDIDDQVKEERNKLFNGMLKTQYMNDNNINVEDVIDTIAFDEIFNTDRLQYTNKLGDIVKGFTSVYNKGVSISNKIKGDKWRGLNYADPERLRYHLISIAKQSASGTDFIRRLQDSEFDEVEKFMSWLNNNRDDKFSVLQTVWWHENNTSDITSFRTYINENGNTSLELNLNNRERTLMENVIDRIVQPFNPNNRKSSPDQQLIYDGLVNSARRITSGNFTNEDLFNVFQYFTTPEMDIYSIWENDRINIGGKVYSLKNAIYNFVTSKSGLLGNLGKKEYNGVPQFGLKDSKNQIKSSVRTFIKSLINENRKYTANLTTIHADGNQHPSRIVDNYLTRNFKQMKRDSQILTKEKFYEKYSRINQSGKGSRSNNLIDFVYNKLKNGQDIDLIEFGGIENDFNQEKSVTLSENDSASDRLNQFIIYTKSAGKNSYLMDTGRYSDSSRAYYMEVPRIETDDVVKFEKGKFVFSDKAALRNIHNTHNALGYEGSYDDFKNLIAQSIKDNVQFIESNVNVLKSDNSLNSPISQLIDKNGKLTTEGKLKVANFELNNIINGTNFTEILFPSFRMSVKGENELVKRAKSGLSPMFSFPNLQIENIYVNDVTVNPNQDNEYTATDSAFYILEKHADKFRAAGGTIMPLGNAFKLLQTGVENYNPNWKGSNIYNKGFATILNNEVVSKNPQLKGVYELLKRRDQKYIGTVGQDTDNLLDGKTHHLPMIVAKSSNKNKLNGIPADYDLNLMDIETINDMTALGNVEAIDTLLDKMYYQENDFIGMSGENFGIQQVMDIDKDQVNSPIQFLKSLTTNMMIHQNSDNIIGILNDIKNLSQDQIQRGFDIIMNGEVDEVRDFFTGLIDEDKVDQTQKDVLLNDKLSLKTPYLRQLVKNTFANYVKKNGLKLKTPGGILREKPTLIKKQYRTSSDLKSTSGNFDLSFYRENADGTFAAGEVVIPNRMLNGSKKKNPLRAREYFVEKEIDENLRLAKIEARKRGTSVGKVFDEENNHIGYYAAGDSIMATRIPSHGPQSTGFFEIVDFTGEEGNNIQLPNDFKNIIGSDNDGDQVFVQHKGRGTKEWNSIFDRIQKHYLDPKTQVELNQPIEFKAQAEEAIEETEKVYGKRDQSFVLPFSSKGREIAFKDTLVSKGNVGIAADLHTTLRMLSSYGVNLKKSVTINGKEATHFFDSEKESITINSAKLFNIILDNSKYGFADKLGINTNTIQLAMVLTNLGFSLTDVSMVLNHPITQEYSALKNRNSGIFNRDEKNSVVDSLTKNPDFKITQKSNSPIVINTESNLTANNQAVFDLIRYVDSLTSNEIKAVGNILSVHNTMSVNPFEIDELITGFNKVVNNEENNNLIFNETFKQNPIVENYIATLEKNKNIQQQMDPAFSESVSKVYKNIIEMSGKTLSKKEHENISNALSLFHASQLLGLNNVSEEEYKLLTAKDSDRNIFDRLKSHMDSLNKIVVERNNQNPIMSKTALDKSLLFTKGLNFNFGGNNKYVSINNEFHQTMIDEELRQQMIREFNQLPVDLRNDLLMYDLMKNGWSGPNSLFPLFNQGIKMQISSNSNIPMNYSSAQLDMLRNRLIRNNPKMFRQYDNVLNFNNSGNFTISQKIGQSSPSLLSAFEKGNPFIFRTQDKEGKVRLVKFNGFTDSEYGEVINTKSNVDSLEFYNYLLNKANSKLFIDYRFVSSNPNLSYITIPHINENLPDTTYDQLKEVENRIKNGAVAIPDLKGRSMKNEVEDIFSLKKRKPIYDNTKLMDELDDAFGHEGVLELIVEKTKNKNLKALAEIFINNSEKLRGFTYGAVRDNIEGQFGILAQINIRTGIISINRAVHQYVTEEEILSGVMHEYVHAFTLSAIRNPKRTEVEQKFLDDITGIYNQLKKNTPLTKHQYGFTNAEEFVAEIMTNPNFVKVMMYQEKPLLNRFIDSFLSLFGVKKKYEESPENQKNVIKAVETILNFIPVSEPKTVIYTRKDGSEILNKKISINPRSDYYNFFQTMDRNQFDAVMNYPQNFEEDRKQENWQKYLDEKRKADQLKSVINDDTVKKMSYEDLIDIYGSEKPLKNVLGDKFDNNKGLGYRNKFAYSEVMRPVIMEMVQRDAADQSKLLQQGADKYGVKVKPLGEDISVIDKWLLSNNIPSSHPATQAVVKKMEIQYKTFLVEKSKYVGKINEATDQLYQEKFGYKVNDRSFIDGVKHLLKQLFSNKEDFYNQLYGSLIVMENVVNDNGNQTTNMRYKTEEEIEAGKNSGEISEAQYNFYRATKDMSDEMLKFTGAKERQGYIPHTAPSTMEAFSRRGLLGVLVNAKTLNERIYDVKLNAKNPITGKMVDGVSFKQVEDWYNALSKSDGKKAKDSIEYTKLKYKAIDLHKKGINQDGTPIRYSNIETGTAIGDVFLDRFSKSRSVKSTDFPSMDLNKAFNDYIHSSLFVHGNGEFQGFKKLLPVIDGLLAQLDRDQNKNMSEYVEKIWKTYFLQGSKQHNLKNYKPLEAIGISTDKVIDYITKGSLIYWLGWKGLAIGGGAYAIGNVLAGKYKNIINEGGSTWLKGEKRFWLGKDGKFNVLDPFKGMRDANEILKTAGFMDINIFDDVAVEKKNGIEQTLMSLALMPMAKTEHWIQGAHFLGKLSDEEWEQLKSGKALSVERMNEIEDEVKLSHGKGYQPTDQRMIQMYSWGRMMMQFSRWMPTSFYDKFSQEDINRYGEYYVGSYRKVYKTVQKAVDGRWDYARFRDYRKNLNDAEKRRLDAGLMGFGLSAILIGANSVFNVNAFDKLVSDENIFADFDRLENKLIPPAISMGENLLK